MRGIRKYGKLYASLLALAACTGVAHADDDPLNDPGVQKTLRAMANASIWFHPDLFGEFAGMRHYAHHESTAAMKYFKVGAYYADKLSQLCVGLMYLNGEGVRKDPVTAYAWFDLAAERDYPDFVATRDNLKAKLTATQLARAEELRKTLSERYADVVAKPRMAGQLHLGQMQITGSHTGFDSGIRQMNAKDTCGPALIVGGQPVPEAGCPSANYYAKDRWEPDLYFAARDREYKATVSVGAIEASGKALDKPPTPPADSAPTGTIPPPAAQH